MTDWYSSIQSVYYGTLIHLNTVCVLWHTDTAQYSLYCGTLIHLNTVCVLCQLIHLNTVCVLWQTDTPPSTHEPFTFFGTICCSHCKRVLKFWWQNHPCKWHFLIRLYILAVSTHIVVTSYDPVCGVTNMMSQYRLTLFGLTIFVSHYLSPV
jgi:hypothetical protein